MDEYEVGDVISGYFSSEISRRHVNAIVQGKVPDADGHGRPGFHGVVLDYVAGRGYGTWGYDDEIEAWRAATDDDVEKAARVQRRVEADTEAFLRGLRRVK